MMEEKSSTALFAVAGLLAPVVAAWAALFAMGSMRTNWMLAGIIALGAGMLVVNVIQRFAPGVFSSEYVEEDDEDVDDLADAPDEAVVEADEEAGEDPDVPAPRTRVLLASSALQGLSAGLLIAYFLGDPIISVVIGLTFGALGAGISTVLARNLSQAA